jgi:hypothetical protein
VTAELKQVWDTEVLGKNPLLWNPYYL